MRRETEDGSLVTRVIRSSKSRVQGSRREKFFGVERGEGLEERDETNGSNLACAV